MATPSCKGAGTGSLYPRFQWGALLEGKMEIRLLGRQTGDSSTSWSQNTVSSNQNEVSGQNMTLPWLPHRGGGGRLTMREREPPWKGQNVTWQSVKSTWNESCKLWHFSHGAIHATQCKNANLYLDRKPKLTLTDPSNPQSSAPSAH